ncbi:hypothetical protein EYF80_043894 [Liparis tanakae]|uniref:Uncharacterized protein n=1 Tax=Liparis tanakae TaxID=230148 RepID=A0A4Z2FZB3_9TELE|nr:hypothetical protein EYF80_043894 [Liparis tanakae]
MSDGIREASPAPDKPPRRRPTSPLAAVRLKYPTAPLSPPKHPPSNQEKGVWVGAGSVADAMK